jgi:WD40 repeat protein
VLGFLGRAGEIDLITDWVLREHCRLIAVLGMGGIGKTSLAARVARDVAPAFERVYWRSVRNAPPPLDWLGEAIAFLSDHRALPPDGESARIAALLDLLRDRHCLLVLDNLEPCSRPAAPRVPIERATPATARCCARWARVSTRAACSLTSREEPLELAELSGDAAVRTLELGGLTATDARALLNDKQLQGSAADWTSLVVRYGGNGLALKVVGESVQQVFGADIAAFLQEAGSGTFGGIRRLLDGQLDRLSSLERQVLAWLGVEREPATFAQLVADLGPRVGRGALLEAVEALRRRSLVERTPRGSAFTLQSVVLEHVTDMLLERASAEIHRGEFDLLRTHALLKARAKDYARSSQERLLLAPLLEHLVSSYGTRRAVEERILALIQHLRELPLDEQQHAPGNLVNLLRVSRGNLQGLDLSGLALRQVFLRDVGVQDSSLAGADLSEAVLAEAFNYPTAVALSPDGSYLAAGTSTGEVCLWHVANRALLETLQGHTSGIRGVGLSGDNRLVATGSFDGTVRLWEATNGRLLMTLRGHVGLVYRVALSADGRLAASGGQDGTVKLWETDSGRLLRTLDGSGGGNWGTALSGDGRLVVAGGSDSVVRLWEVATGQQLRTLQGHTSAAIGVALSRDGRVAAGGSFDGTVKLWDTGSGRLLADLRGHTAGVRGVALSDDGRLVATGSYDGTIKLWEAGGQLLATLQGHGGGV